jgi:hypothetical protein
MDTMDKFINENYEGYRTRAFKYFHFNDVACEYMMKRRFKFILEAY